MEYNNDDHYGHRAVIARSSRYHSMRFPLFQPLPCTCDVFIPCAKRDQWRKPFLSAFTGGGLSCARALVIIILNQTIKTTIRPKFSVFALLKLLTVIKGFRCARATYTN